MIYTIPKGSHRSVWFPKLTFKRELSFVFSFPTPIYETDFTNKVYGFIDGIDPHYNSVRVGFRRKGNVIIISSIIYNNSVRTITTLKEVDLNAEVSATIKKTIFFYYITINGDTFRFDRTSNCDFFSFMLFPYFGGVDKALTDIKVKIILL